MLKIYSTNSNQLQNFIFGNLDTNRKKIEDALNIDLKIHEKGISISGNSMEIETTSRLFDQLKKKLDDNGLITEQEFNYSISTVKKDLDIDVADLLNKTLIVTNRGKAIKPKTLGQKNYVESMISNDIVFGIGPAGTGKTYLAMAMAIKAFKANDVDRIILTRPAVEAGESLGFLPGDLQEKVDPYLRPIYDALYEILGFDNYIRLREKGLIEVAPLAYMRGRTLDNAYVILDEAQNTTNEQMKMFLTRIGFGSKAVITGDITQIDLPKGKKSGLLIAKNILSNIDGIGFSFFDKSDIVRHPLVQKIINAYEKIEKKS